MDNTPKIYYDIEGREHIVKGLLNDDISGQGFVFESMDEGILIKVAKDKAGNILKDNNSFNKFKKDISRVKSLDIFGLTNFHFSMPITRLQHPYSGYIMRKLRNTMPLKNMLKSDEKYSRTLMYRYVIAIEIVKRINALHKHGLVYCDITLNNILISESQEDYIVYFIDTDNIQYQSEIIKPISTLSYESFELQERVTFNTIYSDIHALAKVIYEVITKGQIPLFTENESSGFDATGDKEPNEWIFYHFSDEQQMFLKNALIHEDLIQLFHTTFSVFNQKDNYKNRKLSPYWYSALINGLSNIITKDCGCERILSNHPESMRCEHSEHQDLVHIDFYDVYQQDSEQVPAKRHYINTYYLSNRKETMFSYYFDSEDQSKLTEKVCSIYRKKNTIDFSILSYNWHIKVMRQRSEVATIYQGIELSIDDYSSCEFFVYKNKKLMKIMRIGEGYHEHK